MFITKWRAKLEVLIQRQQGSVLSLRSNIHQYGPGLKSFKSLYLLQETVYHTLEFKTKKFDLWGPKCARNIATFGDVIRESTEGCFKV